MKANKILLVKSRSLGDSVVMSPAIRELKLVFPQADIDLITSSFGAEVHKYNPHLRKIFVYFKKPFFTWFANFFSLLKKIKEEKYDLVLCFYASISECYLAKLAGVPQRVIYRHELDRPDTFGNVPILAEKKVKSIIERDLDVIRAIGLEPKSTKTEIFLNIEERQFAQDVLSKLKTNDSSLIVFAPGAREKRKCWSLKNFVEVIRYFRVQKSATPIVIHGPGEKEIKKVLSREVGREIFTLEEENILRVAAVLEKCQLFVGNDSGLKHVAVAVDCPTITLMEEKNFIEWHPYDLKRHPVIKKNSLENITVGEVIQLINKHLKKYEKNN